MPNVNSKALNAKSTVLWLLLLFLNSLFTFIGVMLRDVGEEGYCSGVPSDGTNQDLARAKAAMYYSNFPFFHNFCPYKSYSLLL